MSTLWTFTTQQVAVGATPVGHDYWNVSGGTVQTVPAGSDWYSFTIFDPDGNFAMLQDFSPADEGFVPMTAFQANYYGQWIADACNGIVRENALPTSDLVQNSEI